MRTATYICILALGLAALASAQLVEISSNGDWIINVDTIRYDAREDITWFTYIVQNSASNDISDIVLTSTCGVADAVVETADRWVALGPNDHFRAATGFGSAAALHWRYGHMHGEEIRYKLGFHGKVGRAVAPYLFIGSGSYATNSILTPDCSVEGNFADISETSFPDITIACNDTSLEGYLLEGGTVSVNTEACAKCPTTYDIYRTHVVGDSFWVQVVHVQNHFKPEFTGTSTWYTDDCIDCSEADSYQFALNTSVTAVSPCGEEVFVSVCNETSPGPCLANYFVITTFTAVDLCGNEAVLTHTTTFSDHDTPFLVPEPVDYTFECPDAAYADVPPMSFYVPSDNCSAVECTTSEQSFTSCGANNFTEREWVCTDACDNTKTYRQIIRFEDTEAPHFNPESLQPLHFECGVDTVTKPNVTANDDCEGDLTDNIVYDHHGDFTDQCHVIKSRSWDVVDECGNEAPTLTQEVHIWDRSDPVFIDLENVAGFDFSVNGSSSHFTCDNVPCQPDLHGFDACAGAKPATKTPVPNTPTDCPTEYTITWKWTLSDNCGHTVFWYHYIIVEDTIAPILIPRYENESVSCENYQPMSEYPVGVNETINCEEELTVVPSSSTQEGSCDDEYVETRTWTVEDCAGNSDSFTVYYSVYDNAAPNVTSAPNDTTIDCSDDLPNEDVEAIDNCSDVNVTRLPDSEPIYDGSERCGSYKIIRTWSVCDECDRCVQPQPSQEIHVVDSGAPFFVQFPNDTTANCDDVPAVETPTGGDDCSDYQVIPQFSGTGDITTTDCVHNYTISRCWIVRDSCGRESPVRCQIIQVVDTEGAALGSHPAHDEVPCDGIPCPEEVQATDNCEGVTLTFQETTEPGDGTCDNLYVIIRTWNATDACGEGEVWSQRLTVYDDAAPVFTGSYPANHSLECGDVIPGRPVITADDFDENCGEVTIVEDATDSCPLGGCCIRNILRWWNVTDECGHLTRIEQHITITDTLPPAFDLEELPFLNISCADEPIAWDTPVGSDRCAGPLTPTFVPFGPFHTGTCMNGYRARRVWTIRDNCNVADTVVQQVRVNDNIKPTFLDCPGPLDLTCADEVPAPGTLHAQDSDECEDRAATVFYEGQTDITPDDQPDCEHIRVYRRSWRAVDNCDNTEFCVQIITVNDTVAPLINRTNIPNGTVDEACGEISCPPAVCASDNCNDITLEFDEVTSDLVNGCFYNVTRTWTATDACGHTDVASYSITVGDGTPPFFVNWPAGNNTVYECTEPEEPEDPTYGDDCTVATLTRTRSIRDVQGCPKDYDIVFTYTLTDGCGNELVDTYVQKIRDLTGVTITLLGASQNNSEFNTCVRPGPRDAAGSDVCDGIVPVDSYDVVREPGACPYIYTVDRHYNATDDCDRETDLVETFKMTYPGDPELENLPNATITRPCTNKGLTNPVTAVGPCGDNLTPDVNLTTSPEMDGRCSGESFLNRIWTVSDDCGGQDSFTQTVTFVDNTLPYFIVDPVAERTYDGVCSQIAIEELIADDQCAEIFSYPINETDEVDGSRTCLYRYETVQTIRLCDDCENCRDYQQSTTYTWEDKFENRPTLTRPDGSPIGTLLSEIGTTADCDCLPEQPALAAHDHCGLPLLVSNSSDIVPGRCDGEYDIVWTWTATDDCGLSTSLTHTIHVTDDSDPELFFDGDVSDTTVQCGFDEHIPNVTAVDSCGGVTIDLNEFRVGWTPEDCCNYQLVRVWIATDDCGRTTRLVQTVTVEDTIPPVLHNLPFDLTVPCPWDLEENFPNVTAANPPLAVGKCITANSADDECVENAPVAQLSLGSGLTFDFAAGSSFISWITNVSFVSGTATLNGGDQYLVVLQLDQRISASNAQPGLDQSCYDSNPALNPNAWTVYSRVQGNITQLTGGDAFVHVEGSFAQVGQGAGYGSTLLGVHSNFSWTSMNAAAVAVFGQEGTSATLDLALDESCDRSDWEYPELDCDDEIEVHHNVSFVPNCAESNETGVYVITFWAQDDAGLIVVGVWTVTVVDNTKPTWDQATLESLAAEELISYDCDVPAPQSPNASDTCSDVTVVLVANNRTSLCDGRVEEIRHWRACDECNNCRDLFQTVHAIDNTGPAPFEDFPDQTAECLPNAAPAPPAWDDNCSDATVRVGDPLEEKIWEDPTCPFRYTWKRTWQAVDDCGNPTEIEEITEVDDSNPPNLVSNPPSNYNVECAGQYADFAFVAVGNLTFFDQCSLDIEVQPAISPIGDGCSKTETYTWVAQDDCERESEPVIRTATITDSRAPFITVSPATLNLTCTEEAGEPTITYGDDCNPIDDLDMHEILPALQFTDPLCIHHRIVTRRWVVTDLCGRQAFAQQVITYNDFEHPDLVGDFDRLITIKCTDEIPCPPNASATDDCNGVDLTYNETIYTYFDTLPEDAGVVLQCPQERLIKRKWVATDACGKKDFLKQYVYITQGDGPEIVGNFTGLDNQTISCADFHPEDLPPYDVLHAEDDCSEPSIEHGDDEYTFDPVNPCNVLLTRMWWVCNDCNKCDYYNYTITIIDDQALECSDCEDWPNVTIECTAGAQYPTKEEALDTNNRTWSHACDRSFTPIHDCETTEGCGETFSIDCLFTAEETSGCGPEPPVYHTYYSVVDTLPPTLSGSPGRTEECVYQHGPYLPVAPTGNDQCSGPVEADLYNTTDVSDGDDCPSTFVRRYVYTATDDCGLESAPFTYTVTVVDTRGPKLSQYPNDTTVECGGAIPPVATVSGFDECQGPLPVEHWVTTEDGDCGDEIIIHRHWSVCDCRDLCDNHTQTITVTDTSLPYWTSPQEDTLHIACSADLDVAAILQQHTPTADDDCGNANISFTDSTPQEECEYQVTRTWTLVDDCGLEATPRTFTVNVSDSEGPILDDVANWNRFCDQPDSPPTVGGSDECDNGFTIDAPTFIVNVIDECTVHHVYTWNARDDCGNPSSVSATAIRTDNTRPFLVSGPSAPGPFECDNLPTIVPPVFDDVCGGVITVVYAPGFPSVSQGDCPNNYTITHRWIATDECGNTNDHTYSYEVFDGTAPHFLNLPDEYIEVNCTTEECPPTMAAEDNCGGVTISFSAVDEPGCPNTGVTTRTWRVFDDCGNEGTPFVQIFNVTDLGGLTWNDTLPGNDTNVDCTEWPDYPEQMPIVGSDDCGEAFNAHEQTFDDGECDGNMTVIRYWNITDECGNVLEHTQYITVTDTTPPMKGNSTDLCLTPVLYDINFDLEDATVNGNWFTFTDDCSDSITLEIVACTSNQDAMLGVSVVDGFSQDCQYYSHNDSLLVRARAAISEPNGRLYTVTVRATDDCGNFDTQDLHIWVPRDQNSDADEFNLDFESCVPAIPPQYCNDVCPCRYDVPYCQEVDEDALSLTIVQTSSIDATNGRTTFSYELSIDADSEVETVNRFSLALDLSAISVVSASPDVYVRFGFAEFSYMNGVYWTGFSLIKGGPSITLSIELDGLYNQGPVPYQVASGLDSEVCYSTATIAGPTHWTTCDVPIGGTVGVVGTLFGHQYANVRIPIENALVELRSAGGALLATTFSDPAGHFVFCPEVDDTTGLTLNLNAGGVLRNPTTTSETLYHNRIGDFLLTQSFVNVDFPYGAPQAAIVDANSNVLKLYFNDMHFLNFNTGEGFYADTAHANQGFIGTAGSVEYWTYLLAQEPNDLGSRYYNYQTDVLQPAYAAQFLIPSCFDLVPADSDPVVRSQWALDNLTAAQKEVVTLALNHVVGRGLLVPYRSTQAFVLRYAAMEICQPGGLDSSVARQLVKDILSAE